MRKQELAVLDEVLDRTKSAVEVVLTEGVSAAMNRFNRRPDDREDGSDEADESKGSKEK
jgi:PTH1 family peptidyl-tRNA hydrolase